MSKLSGTVIYQILLNSRMLPAPVTFQMNCWSVLNSQWLNITKTPGSGKFTIIETINIADVGTDLFPFLWVFITRGQNNNKLVWVEKFTESVLVLFFL